MKAARLLFTILILAIAAGLWLAREKQSQVPQENLTQELRPKSAASYATPVTPVISSMQEQPPDSGTSALSRQSPPSPALPPYASAPDGNRIEFKIINGYAVAYGDILIGKPAQDFTGNRGAYDAPKPLTWPSREIPYAINPDLPNPSRVEKALDYLRQKTPLQFVPYQGQKDAIVFEQGNEHCISYLGRIGGLQPIRLTPECRPQEILHEVLHALGFIHEQSRPDRDHYVEILWSNIDPKYQDQFAMAPESFAEAERGSGFDFRSVMLYRPDAFALAPGTPTLRSLSTDPIAPVQDGLSPGDIQRINRVYSGVE